MSKHTPGPWVVDGSGIKVFADVSNGYPPIVAQATSGDNSLTLQTMEANARLIAAAPDLLAALERANSILAELTFSEWIPKKDSPSIDIRNRINAAHVIASSSIAKAGGAA